jgi:hypothetical protein
MSSIAPIHSESRGAASSRSWLCALAMMLLVFTLSNSDLVLARSVPIWDGDSLYGPYQMLVADHARAGQLLLWNPWTLGGTPDSAEPQAGAFSPVAVLIGAIAGGTLSGFCAYWLFVWLLGGTGMMMLARHFRAPAWGGFIVTMAFLFSGLYMGHASHTSYLSSFAYLPWFLWRLDVAMTEHRLWPAAEAGALWGLSALSGYPAMTILTPCYGAAWALGRTWLSQAPEDGKKKAVLLNTSLPRQIWFLVLALAVVCVVGVLVLAPPYVGLLTEAVGVTERIGERPRVIAIGQSALHPGALLTFASPYLSSLKLWNPTLWPYTDITHVSVHLGSVVPALAVLALVLRPRDARRWWIAGLAASGIVLALGQALPFRGWLYDLFPPARVFRHAGLFRNYTLFFVSILALMGARDLARALDREDRMVLRRWVIVTAVVAAGAVLSYYAVLAHVLNPGPHPLLGQAHLWVFWGALVLSATFIAVHPKHARVARATLVLLAVVEPFIVRLLSGTVATSKPEFIRLWVEIDKRRSASLDLAPQGLQRELLYPDPFFFRNKNLPLKLPVLYGYTSFTNAFHEAWVRDPLLSAAATQPGEKSGAGLQRLWFAPEAPIVPPTKESFEVFRARARALGGLPIVRHMREAMPAGRGQAALSSGESKEVHQVAAAVRIGGQVLAYRPTELALRVDAPSDGWLLVTDRWSPSWRAVVNGDAAELWPADFLFRAVRVRPGPNEVRFLYTPRAFPGLWLVSWGTLLTVGVLSVAATVHRSRSPGTFPGERPFGS